MRPEGDAPATPTPTSSSASPTIIDPDGSPGFQGCNDGLYLGDDDGTHPLGLGPDSLCAPFGVAVDAAGNLYRADTGNRRVLEYNTPFSSGPDPIGPVRDTNLRAGQLFRGRRLRRRPLRDTITAAEVAGFDETGFRVDSRLHRVHCARTGKYTLLVVHPKRGRQAMEAMGILSSFTGVAVHDAWLPYDTYMAPDHQLCCAHALRELQAVTDAAPAGQWCWATQAAEAITAMQALVREAISQGHDAVDPAALAAQVRLFRSAVLAGVARPPPAPGR